MDNKTDVGFVNAHAKGDRGHNHARASRHELVLHFGTVLDASVIVVGGHALTAQQLCQLLATATRVGIHNTRAQLIPAEGQQVA